ncbi:MAG TPA: LTA synthase family protein [Candidatus Jeotgalibaca pullicola]|nr:LTA synthase family protein [Candidatus Jeotgalibaca pullicola]
MTVSLVSVFFLQFFHFQFDFNKAVGFLDYQTKLSFLQAIIIFILYMWFYFLTVSNAFSSVVLLFFTTIIGIGTQQKSLYRGEPLYPSDIYFLKDFTFLLEMVDVGIVISIVVVFIALIASLVLYFKKRRKPHLTKNLKITRIVSFAVTTLLLFYIYQFNQPGNKVKAIFNDHVEWISYSQERNYSQNGVVSGLMYNLKSPAVNRPDGYSKEKIQELFEKYSNEANAINSTRTDSLSDYNFVFVMNETFSDPLRIEGMSISEDPMPLYRELIKSNVSGQALSQGYGGGTANIEFEALTGISLEPLSSNITTPFIQLSGQMKDLPTIVDTMKENNLNLTAIHPYNTTMYKRLENYQSLGFDNYLFQDDMKYTDRIDENTFISDEAAYKEVLEVINSSEEKDFVHLVTMQNHKPFVHKYEDVEFTVEGAPYNLEVAHYAKGIQYSDYALDQFLREIDTLDEKTIVVFWGDHLPSFYGNELFERNGHVTMHETPLMFYTNFSEDTRDIGTISPMFFIVHVLEQANAPVSPFVALLQKLEVVLPAFEKGIYLERETKLQYDRENLKPSTQLLLNEYDLILYDITTGKNYSRELGFY